MPPPDSDPQPATPVPDAGPSIPKSSFSWKEWSVVVVVLGLIAAIAIPNFVRARTTACKNACIANLKQIDGAVQQWAMENKKRGTDSVNIANVLDYLKGSVLPICPSAGTYSVSTVSAVPRCTVGNFNPGHTL